MMADKVFPDAAIERFNAAYPIQPIKLSHRLNSHPLLEVEALEKLALRLRPEDMEYNKAVDLPIGIDQHATPSNGLSIVETIRSIETCGTWIVLKQVQQVPEYRVLLEETLAEVRDVVRPMTGEMLKLESFIFLSSPRTVTPLHIDPEYNILLQIRGRKAMTVFPADDGEIAPPDFYEAYYTGGQRNLPWREEFASRGQVYELATGDAVYVPVLSPHWVANGDEVSVSLSITWRTRWTYDQAYAHCFNKRLRGFGISPAPPPPFPHRHLMKSLTERGLSKAERAFERIRNRRGA